MKRLPQTLDSNRHPLYWWAGLPAVPAERESAAYQRLERVWFDHTRFGGAQGSYGPDGDRRHEFATLHHETHLTTTLWENFVLFPPSEWIPGLFAAASLPLPPSSIVGCNWSYEWAQQVQDEAGKSRGRMCDVVVEYELEDGSRHVLVVEAKSLGKMIGAKELDMSYYLEIPRIAAFGNNRSLLFLLDDACCEAAHGLQQEHPDRVGVITWQQLGGLQIELALKLDCAPVLRSFIAGAIQYQYASHDIRPTTLAAPYLEDEPSMRQMDELPKERKQSMAVHSEAAWELDRLEDSTKE